MDKVKNLLSWLNNNLLFILSTFLIAFIPLFPKIPIFDVLPGYIVRARAEDVLIFITALIWLRDAYKRKVEIKSGYFWLIMAYTLVGISTIIIGTLLSLTIPKELLHIGKSGLHFFRYMEYFLLFFFLYSAIKTKKHIKIILVTLVLTLIGIVGYGFGQQYLHFPLYSTMNREFSKGQKLYLQENARPQSTFAGHYDLGAYLVIVLPLIFALSINNIQTTKKIKEIKFNEKIIYYLKQKQTYSKLFLHFLHLLGAWMLVTSGSKTALAAYLAGILVVLFFYIKKLGNFKQQIKWGIISLVSLTIILGVTITLFGQETQGALLSIAQQSNTANKIISKIPGLTLTESTRDASVPDDLYGEGHEIKIVITIDEEGNEVKEVVRQQSQWSDNALKYGISMGIRLDTLWPQAIKGLINNPLFGNAYGTLSRTSEGQFVEADSTDNNFLRTLGETGLLGFITFYGLIIVILIQVAKNTNHSDPLIKTINIGFTGSIIGLLINATYIDVFAASKVAFSFWALSGIMIKSGRILKDNKLAASRNKTIENIFKHLKINFPVYLTILLGFFILHRNPYTQHSTIKDFNTSNKAIENVVTAKCFINTGSYNLCRNNGAVLKSNPNIYSFLLTPYLKLNINAGTFYFLNFTIFVLALLTVNKIATLNKLSKTKKLITLLSIIALSSRFQLTQAPLTNIKLLLFITVTVLIALFITLTLKIKSKRHIQASQTVFLIIIVLCTFRGTTTTQIAQNFRNNIVVDRYQSITRANFKFSEDYLLTNDNKKGYLISGDSPYYTDLYSNNNYNLLPLSSQQDYINQANSVWGEQDYSDLNELYSNILSNKETIYLTDYSIHNNPQFINRFNSIKRDFTVKYDFLDCNEKCNLYSIKPNKEIVSTIPDSINVNNFNLSVLESNFKFSVISNRYQPKQDSKVKAYNTTSFTEKLNKIHDKENSFIFITGDVVHAPETILQTQFAASYGNLITQPILYNKGNQDLADEKIYKSKDHTFFAGENYFIFLNTNMESQVSDKQHLFIYNSLLEIEKLPETKNLFIISDNLDWQNKRENNFIDILDKKLSEYPDLNKIIITSNKSNNNEQTSKIDELKNTLYLSSQLNDTDTDSYLNIEVIKSNKTSLIDSIIYSYKQLSD